MNSFDIILISITGVIVLIGLIFGLTKGGRFFLTLAGSVSISAFVMIPVMKIISEQEWFVNLSKIFLGHNMLSVVFYFALLGLATFIIHFILNLLFKLIGLTVKDEKFASHIGGLFLGVINGALLFLAVLLVFDYMHEKVEVTSLEQIYTSFFYTYLKPVLTFVNGGN